MTPVNPRQMLEASPEELRGTGDTQVSATVKQSESGRALAHRLLDGQENLHQHLSGIEPLTPADDVLDRILNPMAKAEASRERRPQPKNRRDRPVIAIRTLRRATVTLLLFCCVFGWWFLQKTGPEIDNGPFPFYSQNAPIDVQLVTDQNVIIFETNQPDIKIVWFY